MQHDRRGKQIMKKIMLGACIILGAILVFLYKVGEDMTSMHRCGNH